jgi:major intracellular serine protease
LQQMGSWSERQQSCPRGAYAAIADISFSLKGESMRKPHSVIRIVMLLCTVLVVSNESPAQVKRYAILGDNMPAAETALANLGINKIKRFKHFSGLAVNLSDSQADTLRSSLGSGLRLINDQPFKAFDDVEIQAKPGGGGGGPGGQQVPWGINAVNAPAAWSVTRGAGVAVCVVDTGLDQDHPDLAANIARGANYINGGSWDDDNGHGTHVGGTIAALDNSIGVVGVAPQATLLAAKALDRRGQGTFTDIAEAIYGCRDLNTDHLPLVVNMSISLAGTEDREIVHAPIRELQAEGVIFTGAAGNSSIGEVVPGRWPEALLITGVDQDLNFASFSGWNSGLLPPPEYRDPDFTAPAVSVLSTWKGGGTKTLDGTSMATAYASGVAALGLAAGTLEPLTRDPDLYPGVPTLLVPLGRDIGLIPEKQGQGLIDALLTVQNQPNLSGANVVPEPGSAAIFSSALAWIVMVWRRTKCVCVAQHPEAPGVSRLGVVPPTPSTTRHPTGSRPGASWRNWGSNRLGEGGTAPDRLTPGASQKEYGRR